MRCSTLVSALLVAGAISSPVHQKLHNKRAIVYEVVTDIVIEYVTDYASAPTSVQAPNDPGHHHSSTTPAPAPVTSTSTTPVAVTTSVAPVTTSVAPVSSSVAVAPSTTTSSSSDTGAGNGPLPATLDADGTLYQEIVLTHHNVHRANHSASALNWNATLAQYAKEQAMTCVYSETLPAGQPGGWGQNIAAGAQVVNVSAVITGQFYNGEEPVYPGYGEASPDMSNFQNWGHFSQVVWGNTESVGCYSYTCNPTNDCQANGQPYLANTPCGPGGVPAINHVCNYYPPGNYAGEYTQVGSPAGNPGVVVNGQGVSGLPS
ncbi:Cysteine-rich secretory protein, allergen V5/Tpx-1-related [Lasallia pustulata]|uniref:Cysteine-rich secretory protein, allergen V5/Tpx-1-related n=1 Tax=Lasallia pustulata TaxID=136370 RepID=A0A1W5CU12_9LECA|nr:Cysteine-rich secretory protein, allergen V5/Tpx-1-related [Lasallia pustulata]